MPSTEEIILKLFEGFTQGAITGRDLAAKLKMIEEETNLKQAQLDLDTRRVGQTNEQMALQR